MVKHAEIVGVVKVPPALYVSDTASGDKGSDMRFKHQGKSTGTSCRIFLVDVVKLTLV